MFTVIKLLLSLLAFCAKRVGDLKIEKGALDALESLQADRVRAANSARSDVTSGRVPEQLDDPNRRD